MPKGSLIDERNQIKNITKSFATLSLNQSRTATSNLGFSEFSNTHTNDESRADSSQSKDEEKYDYSMKEAKALDKKAKTEGLEFMINIPTYLLDRNAIKLLKTEDYTENVFKVSAVKPVRPEKNFLLKVKVEDFVMRQSYVIRVLRIVSKVKVDEDNHIKPIVSDRSQHTEDDFHFSLPNSKRGEMNDALSSERMEEKYLGSRHIVKKLNNNTQF